MTSAAARPLWPQERALLDALLAHDFPGVEGLRTQARDVTALAGCDGGCGSITLVVAGEQTPSSGSMHPAPAQASIVSANGEEVGGLILFVRDGSLFSLEVYSNTGDPLALPTLDQVEWFTLPI